MNTRGQVDAEKDSGSLNKSEPEFLAVGKLRKPFGLTGEMKFEPFIDDLNVFAPGRKVFTGRRYSSRMIASLRESGNNLLIRFEGIENPEAARILATQNVYIPAGELPPLEEGIFYHSQLIGINVEDDEGNKIGELKEIIETGANDVYVIFDENEQKDILVPAIKSVILKIDIESNLMVVKQPEWFD